MSGRRPTRLIEASAGRPCACRAATAGRPMVSARSGPCADQRGERVLGERDRLVDLFDVGAGLRRARFGLLLLGAAYRGRSSTRCVTSFSVCERISSADLQAVAPRVERRQIGIGRGDAGGQRQPRFVEFVARRVGVRRRRRGTRRGSCPTDRGPARRSGRRRRCRSSHWGRRRRRHPVLAELRLVGGREGVDRRLAAPRRRAGRSLPPRAAAPRRRPRSGEPASASSISCGKLRVAIALPPAVGRPVGARRGKRLVGDANRSPRAASGLAPRSGMDAQALVSSSGRPAARRSATAQFDWLSSVQTLYRLNCTVRSSPLHYGLVNTKIDRMVRFRFERS